jgi:hypothetical protein
MFRAATTSTSPKIVFTADVKLDQHEFSGSGFSIVLTSSYSGKAAGLRINRDGPAANIVQWSDWTSSSYSELAPILADDGMTNTIVNQWLTVELTSERQSSSTSKLSVTLRKKDGTVIYINNQSFTIPIDGDYIGLRMNGSDSVNSVFVDNIVFNVAPGVPTDSGSTETNFTNYVFTYVNEFGEEGAPSPVSRTVQIGEGITVLVTFPIESLDSGYSLTNKRLYRAVTSSSGTDYQFITEEAVNTTTYSDSKRDEELGEVLETVDWDLPPSDGHSILALPNGIMVMASKNQICPSVINRPHTYPIPYRLNTESDVVALGAIDAGIVVGTKTYPYIVVGSDPANLSMAKFEQQQACVSKDSMVTIRGYGVIYASPDGLVAINGAGGLSLITEPYFSRKEWQAIGPQNLIGFAHDDRYFGFIDGASVGFIFDPRQLGNGLTWINYNTQAGFSDPMSDKLYLVQSGTLKAWDEGTGKLTYTWRSKQFKLPRAGNFRAAQVRGDDYSSITFKVYSNRNPSPLYTKIITSESEFVLPDVASTYLELEVVGTSAVRDVQIAEEMEELT